MLNFEEDFTPAVQPAIDVPAFLRKESTAPAAHVADAPAVAPQTRRVQAADKRVINGATDVNQLVPFKYKWA
ncbi:MAG: ribonucleotide-diphosphate reductase subunit beta, partial [Rubrivivax sp.]|nr:ribonucleotide-diphosphate reductase subunit beta [Rubrivivax sp.]